MNHYLCIDLTPGVHLKTSGIESGGEGQKDVVQEYHCRLNTKATRPAHLRCLPLETKSSGLFPSVSTTKKIMLFLPTYGLTNISQRQITSSLITYSMDPSLPDATPSISSPSHISAQQ
ncbi:hypothetical protein ONS95_011599 [Cadophora gregata]|uniref:uncharacterized protein n=1 Tax=Cadophora gregata TaxID=51156 RepID=UPI0026DBCB1E|nr:uncharacterized protein ONS95_011599 [Cadophora gregata]KAK0120193.1 hypothetical protein ONS95_011599 [Cadophora gregata]KAK0121225.1 hypothetical protein ONS96_011402 [Cadophora gregata f. sp. sojae]